MLECQLHSHFESDPWWPTHLPSPQKWVLSVLLRISVLHSNKVCPREFHSFMNYSDFILQGLVQIGITIFSQFTEPFQSHENEARDHEKMRGNFKCD